jgi:transcriptional regulator with XRE-family HTH domain
VTHSDSTNKTPPTRDGKGHYERNIDHVSRNAEAARLRRDGLTYRQIAEALGTDSGTAYRAVEQAMDAVIREPAEQVIAYTLRNLAAERSRLMDLRAEIEPMMTRAPATVQHGKVVYDEVTGEPVPDREFLLKVADRLIKIDDQLRRNDESRRRLEGLDQPAKTNVTGNVTYEILGMSDPGT